MTRPKGSKNKPKIPVEETQVNPPENDEQISSSERSSDEFIEEMMLAKPRKRHNTIEYTEETLRRIGECAKLFMTIEEIAGVLFVHRRTLHRFFEKHPDAQEIYEDGLQFAKMSLRRKQLRAADRHPVMAIFLGKQYLGQKDEVTRNLNVFKPAREMSEDELQRIANTGRSRSRVTETEEG